MARVGPVTTARMVRLFDALESGPIPGAQDGPTVSCHHLGIGLTVP